MKVLNVQQERIQVCLTASTRHGKDAGGEHEARGRYLDKQCARDKQGAYGERRAKQSLKAGGNAYEACILKASYDFFRQSIGSHGG